jgi:hypothetical protein
MGPAPHCGSVAMAQATARVSIFSVWTIRGGKYSFRPVELPLFNMIDPI